MIPKETKLDLVRISNLTQRMTDTEKQRFNGVLNPEKITTTSKGGRCIPGEEWNQRIRPIMLESSKDKELNFKDIEERLQLIAEKNDAQMALDIKNAFCRWYRIEKITPEDGDIVILFLMDGSTILTKWDSGCDRQAIETRLFLKGRYPIFWCPAWQMYNIITLKSLEIGLNWD